MRGSKFVGIDSIRKLTTPGSVWTVREQEESRRRKEREGKEAKEVREEKERKTALNAFRLEEVSVPLPPSLPKPPPLPFLPCIAHLAQHYRLLRTRCARNVCRSFVQGLARQHGECKCFLRISR